jgi:hypothetical protein
MKKAIVAIAALGVLALGYQFAVRGRKPTADELAAEAVGRMIATGTYDPGELAAIQQRAQAAAEAKPKGRVETMLERVGMFFHRDAKRADPTRNAQARVELLLAYWKDGDALPSPSEQAAASLWFRGTPYIPNGDEAQAAMDGFHHWRGDMNLDHAIQGFLVVDTSRRKDFTAVEVRINRGTYHIGVADAPAPLFWTE